MTAFLNSCRSQGISTIENSLDADAAVIWSVLWNGRMANNQQIYQHYRRHNRPVIVIDVGALHRGITWKIALNNVNALGYYGNTVNLDLNRPSKLNLTLGRRCNTNSAIVIAAQHNKSLQTAELSSMENWILEQIKKIQQVTDRSILVRPHPRCRLDLSTMPVDVQIELPSKLSNTYDSFNLRFDYHALVNYNSGPGIQAAIAGCPIIVDSTSLAYPLSIAYNQLNNPPDSDRQQWLVEICHTEYTVQEIEQGIWLKRLSDRL